VRLVRMQEHMDEQQLRYESYYDELVRLREYKEEMDRVQEYEKKMRPGEAAWEKYREAKFRVHAKEVEMQESMARRTAELEEEAKSLREKQACVEGREASAQAAAQEAVEAMDAAMEATATAAQAAKDAQ
jgi:hypothetical protein